MIIICNIYFFILASSLNNNFIIIQKKYKIYKTCKKHYIKYLNFGLTDVENNKTNQLASFRST